jgi:ERF superfamily
MDNLIEDDQPTAAHVVECALIYAALAKARGEFPAIPKNRVATVKSDKASYSYKYADLSDVFEAVDPVLSAYGITVFQRPVGNDLETVIAHESGQVISGIWPIRAMKGQGLDSAMSYQAAVQVAKRYALTAMLGISTEETVEGDHRRKEGMPEGINENFETGDGIRMPRGAKFTKDMTTREKAVEAARAIEDQFDEAKTAVGVSGAWDRNSKFIDLLAEKHDDLYQNLMDKFQFLMDSKA